MKKVKRRSRKRSVKTYTYECTITQESYKLTTECKNPDELVSVNAYYQLHPEEDDRPLAVKKRLGLLEEQES